MDKNETIKNLIIERYNNLQPEIQAVIMDTNYEVNLLAISQKYTLTSEQLSDLEKNTTLVLLGQTNPSEYASNLMEDLDLPDNVIQNIVTDVNEKILKDILPIIKQNFIEEEDFEDTNETETENNTIKLPIDPRFTILPKEVQSAIASSDYQKKLYEIGTEYKLPINKMAILEDITVKLITAKISPIQYESELAVSMEMPKEKVSEIISKVNEQILKGIREIMKKEGEPLPTEDEVPVPPYAAVQEINAPILKKEVPKNETAIYADAGIEMIEEKADPENDLIKNIIGSKLRSSTISNNKVSDHTIPKVGNTPAPAVQTTPQAPVINSDNQKKYDPYHEAIN